MVEPSEKGLALGKRLAHVDKDVRDQAVADIQQLLSQDEEFTYMEMMRHWKALFYCFWLSDKPLVQQELSWSLAGLVLECKAGNRATFVRAFWDTLCREWFEVDKHRVDKYLLLARRMVFFTFQSMRQNEWDQALVRDYIDVYQQLPISPREPRVPNSIRSHVADVYLDELVRLAGDRDQQGDVPQNTAARIPVATLVEPFMRLIATTTIRHMPQIIQESVFESLVVRIAEAEELCQGDGDIDGDMAGEDSDREQAGGGDAKDNQIANETLVRLQFLVDSIPEIKARLLAVGGEEPTTASGRKRLYVLYQALCDTFPDESDVAFARRVSVKTPTGAVERKASDKRKRKRESKTRERKEKRKRKTAPKQNIVATASAEMDANALVREATADEESGYQQDIVKIRAMEKRAGFAGADDSKGKSTSKKAKRAANKKGQQKQRPQAASADEAPMLVPISSSAAPTGAPAANGCTGRRSSSPGPWVVRDKDPVGAVAGAQGRSQPEGLTSLLSAIDKLVIVRDKAPALVSGAAPGPRAAPSGKAATATRSGRGGRRLMWALEQNSVKRFLKKVPMLPSPEPTPGATHMLPKPVLRKDSAYGKCDLPLLPAEPSAARTKKGGRASKKARPQPRRK